MTYDEDYYENGPATGKSCYENYRWLPELTIPACHHIIREYNIKLGDRILDFGCAKGFYVRAFRMLGYEAFGCDISHYAVSQADSPHVWLTQPGEIPQGEPEFDFVLAKDVFEHMTPAEVSELMLRMRRITRNVIVIVPLGNGEKYNAPENDCDPSHVICEPMEYWEELLTKHCWLPMQKTTHVQGLKQRYYNVKDAHGFFRLVRT